MAHKNVKISRVVSGVSRRWLPTRRLLSTVVREPEPVWAKRAAADMLSVTEDNPTSSQSLLLPLSEAELRPGGEKVQGAKPKSLGMKPTARQKANTPGFCTCGHEQEVVTRKATGSFWSPRPRYRMFLTAKHLCLHICWRAAQLKTGPSDWHSLQTCSAPVTL